MASISSKQNISLQPFNTFHIDVSGRSFIEIGSVETLLQVISENILSEQPVLILGGGSNILFTSNYEGMVLKNDIRGIEIYKEDKDVVWIKAGGGEAWHDLVIYCVDRNFGGIENLSLIPGTVGAAPIQNIGAYGVELVDVFYELEAIEIKTGKKKIFQKDECQFGYRNSVFKNELKGKYFIISVTLKLSKNPDLNISYGAIREVLAKNEIANPDIKDVSNAVISIRKSKLPDPAIIGNAGSFFKNPEIPEAQYKLLKAKFENMPGYETENEMIKIPAGWLIEQCGWKGKRVGNTGSHKEQALVLVNYGNATGKEIILLAEEIADSVFNKFTVEIRPEVNIL